MENTIDIKRMRKVQRELEIASLRQHGPQHGKASTMRSKRDRARCPRLQRKSRSWQND